MNDFASQERHEADNFDIRGELSEFMKETKEKAPDYIEQAKEKLQLGVEVVKESMGKFLKNLKEFNPFAETFDWENKNPKEKIKDFGKEALMFLAYLFKPEKEKAKEMSDQEVVEEIEKEAKKVAGIRETYHKSPEGSPEKQQARERLQNAFIDAIGKQESSGFSPEKQLRLVNMHTIVFENKKGNPNALGAELLRHNIRLPQELILETKANSLFGEGLGTYKEFKEKLEGNFFPPPLIGSPEQVAKVLSVTAIGRYQIVPYYHFERMGWKTTGEEGLKNIYEFMKSEDKQRELMNQIVSRLGEKYDWNYVHMAVAFYSGEKWADKLKNEQKKLEDLGEEQSYGYPSIKKYATSVLSMANDFLKEG